MPSSNVHTVHRLFAAVEAGDVNRILQCYAPDIVIAEAETLPYGGEYRGHDGALRHCAAYAATWSPLQTREDQRLDPEIHDAGDTVVVQWRQRGSAPQAGTCLDLPAVSVYRLRAGRIVASRMYQDSAAILRWLAAARSDG